MTEPKILVVLGKKEGMLEVASGHLNKNGLNAHKAYNLEAARRKIAEEHFDAVVIGDSFKYQSGTIDFVQELKIRDQSLALFGLSHDSDVLKAMNNSGLFDNVQDSIPVPTSGTLTTPYYRLMAETFKTKIEEKHR